MPSPLREDQHRARAVSHAAVGRTLAEVHHEWAAVPLFYAAYHLVKLSLLRDPVWEHPTGLSRINVDLMPEDRFTARHRGRRRSGQAREWGVNELVQVLYKPVVLPYERLHQASILVRYGMGIEVAALPSLVADLGAIEELETNGDLQAPVLWTEDQ